MANPRSVANVIISFGTFANFKAKLFAAAREEGSGLHLVGLVGGEAERAVQQYTVGGRVVPFADLQRGVEVKEDDYIVIPKHEIDACKATSSDSVVISKFVPLDEVDPLFFDKSFYVAPDPGKDKNPNAPAIVAYAMLLAALKAAGEVGQAKLEMRGKEHNVIIRASGDKLMLHTIFNTSEIRTIDVLRPTIQFTDDMIAEGVKLINKVKGTFEPNNIKSESDEKLSALITRKRAESQSSDAYDATTESSTASTVDALMAAMNASMNTAAK